MSVRIRRRRFVDGDRFDDLDRVLRDIHGHPVVWAVAPDGFGAIWVTYLETEEES